MGRITNRYNLLTFVDYTPLMSKNVVSFRLSVEELRILDEACRRFGINRSQAVSAGIKGLLGAHIDKDNGSIIEADGGSKTLPQRAPWFKKGG